MKGQFNDKAKIISNGAGLEVTGPLDWEPDETGAVIHVRVVQERQGGEGQVVATGDSAFTPSGAGTWSASLTAHSGTLRPGMADAKARASVSLDNGHTEPYSWPDTVDLVA